MTTLTYDSHKTVNYPPLQLSKLHWFDKENLAKDTPIIDVKKLNTEEELKKLIQDAQENKFFYIDNHEIEEALIEALLNEQRKFFSLPEEEKMKFSPSETKNDVGGYMGFGATSVAKISGRGQAADQLIKYIFSTYKNDFSYPNKIFEKACKIYSEKLRELARFILDKMFTALALVEPGFKYTDTIKEDFINKGFVQNMEVLYPAVKQDKDATERMATHFDTSLITLLYQIPALGEASDKPYIGFEVEENGKRIPVAPLRGTFLMNFGELIHHLTGGGIPATYHGVKRPSDEQLISSERMSIVGFYFPDPQAKIKQTSLKGSMSYNAIKNGYIKEGIEIAQQDLRKAMFKDYAY